MSKPSLADTSRDIAGDIPSDLFERWADPRARTPALATELLEPFALHGTVVCSDTAGLSRMASVQPLSIVLKKIAEPKAKIHALGTGLGGRAIGIWIADNTEMFYPPHISHDDLLAGMIRLHDEGPVQVGISLHTGTFYEVGGGLYGPDADTAEILAENHSNGLDTLVTPAFRSTLTTPEAFSFREASFGRTGTAFYTNSNRKGPSILGSPEFPYPYDPGMHALLKSLDLQDPLPVVNTIEATYLNYSTVLLAERHGHRPATSLVQTLNGLYQNQVFQKLALELLPSVTSHWNVGGALALAAFSHPKEALKAARRLRSLASAAGLTVSIGLESGRTYLFPMPEGRTEFAGDPVNRASKMAEDLCDPGDLCMSQTLASELSVTDAEPVQWKTSGIAIDAWRIPSA